MRWSEPLGLGFPLGRPQVVRTVVVSCIVAGFFLIGTAAQLRVDLITLLHQLTRSARFDLSAPITEEFVFRGVLLAELINWARDSSDRLLELRLKFWGVLLLSSVVFVLVHWPWWWTYLGLEVTLRQSAPLLVTGVILGFVFANTRSCGPVFFCTGSTTSSVFTEAQPHRGLSSARRA